MEFMWGEGARAGVLGPAVAVTGGRAVDGVAVAQLVGVAFADLVGAEGARGDEREGHGGDDSMRRRAVQACELRSIWAAWRGTGVR